MRETIHDIFAATSAKHPDKPFICVPPSQTRDWLKEGGEFTYGDTATRVERLRRAYADAGYGHGHRVLVSVENRHEHFEHFMALNALGVSLVPGNADYRHDELVYHIGHSESDLVVTVPKLKPSLEAAAKEAGSAKPVAVIEMGDAIPPARRAAPLAGKPHPQTEAILLYTSGSTGYPKGSITSNRYAFVLGEWFLSWGGHMTLKYGEERIYNPLPFYHLFMGLHTPTWVMMHAGCMIIPDRFSPARFWKELGQSGATIAAFLGLMPPLLLAADPTPEEKQHRCLRSICAGMSPAMRDAFEARFAIPVLDGWGMTEVARNIGNYDEPRDLAKGAIGRTRPPMEARIVNDDDQDLPDGEVGELLLRSTGPDPRDGFTSGYLKDPEATERAWRGGWFHTGDYMKRGSDGMIYFVDRKKNIIRRSGENIAAAEVEQTIMGHPSVRLCVCIAAPDDLRQEEVMALVVPKDGVEPTRELAEALVAHALANLTYYKVPGWVRFMKDLPMSGSQKIQKFRLFPGNEDPRDGAIDLRERKSKRRAPRAD